MAVSNDLWPKIFKDEQRLGSTILISGIAVLVVGLAIGKLPISFWSWFPLITIVPGISLQIFGYTNYLASG